MHDMTEQRKEPPSWPILLLGVAGALLYRLASVCVAVLFCCLRPIRRLFPMLCLLVCLLGCAGQHALVESMWSGPDWPVFTDAAADYAETRAMDAYRAVNPRCAVCGLKRCIVSGHANNVHHILPRSRRPDLAACQTNFVTLCRVHHFWIGHCGDWRAYNENLMPTIEAVKQAYESTARKAR